MRSIRLAKTLSALSAAAVAFFFTWTVNRSPAPGWYHAKYLILVDPTYLAAIAVFAYSYLVLAHVGRFDPVVAWAANAWEKADYGSALFRLHLFSWRDRRAPFIASILTAANFPDQAYAVATNARLPETDMEDPSYDLDFACGRAALAQRNLNQARRHLDRLYERFPGSALACYALGDLLLWQNVEPAKAYGLLSGALADANRACMPHWARLGFEAELRASYAWSLAVIGKPEELQDSLDRALTLAGQNRPVRAAVHLRLGNALRTANHFTMAHQHWRAAREVDPHGWAGNQAARELEDLP